MSDPPSLVFEFFLFRFLRFGCDGFGVVAFGFVRLPVMGLVLPILGL